MIFPVHLSHSHDCTHLSLFNELGTTLGSSYMFIPQIFQLIKMEHRRAWHTQRSHWLSNDTSQDGHPSNINQALDCLTSVVAFWLTCALPLGLVVLHFWTLFLQRTVFSHTWDGICFYNLVLNWLTGISALLILLFCHGVCCQHNILQLNCHLQ